MGGVLNEDASHGENGLEIDIGTDYYGGDCLTIHEAERGEDGGETEGDETEATHGGYDIGTEEVGIFELDIAKELVELSLLADGKRETNGLGLLKLLVKLEELKTKTDKIVVKGVGGL